ncbi:dipeptidase [Sphingobacterium thalpophilum]|uniref:Dipeptidase n=1 Tax=Sphingobacterium thalpophilum TaxID=259 RepID=A0A4U9UNY6_9SPHI|nr:dipeptidase [Sphingobacterium thalpophilum]VTR35435.1 Membrane dipeptidase (Peptidase family M19) [Sphingobacterium thalpophilum]
MIRNLLLIVGMIAFKLVSGQDDRLFHDDLVVVDGHNDVIYESILPGKDIGQRLSSGSTDLPRLKEGGVDVQVFAVWSDDAKWRSGAFRHANEQLDALEKMIAANTDKIALAKSSADIGPILQAGKIAALIGIEGGNMIENSIENLVRLHERGARYLTLTWNYNLAWASCAAMESDKTMAAEGKGLTALGKEIIKKMNKIGMMVDLSHAGEQTFYDVIAVTDKPILVSHSNAYSLCPHPRNLKDAQLEALKKNGGVVGVNFYSGFLDPDYETRLKAIYSRHFGRPDVSMSTWAMYEQLPKELQRQADAPLSKLLDHIDYLVRKVGIEHVAVGSDFDGIESAPQGLEDVSKFPVLTKALLERGYKKEDIAKIMGQNFLRILKENEGVR